MTATISKNFEFSASHQLEGLPEDHPCSRLHGHNYQLRVELTGETVGPGFVVDYRELSWFKTWVDDVLDHRHLNDVLRINPTAENMAALFAVRVAQWVKDAQHRNVTRVAVAVSETPKTWATVSVEL